MISKIKLVIQTLSTDIYNCDGECGRIFYLDKNSEYVHTKCYDSALINYVDPGTKPECPSCLIQIASQRYNTSMNTVKEVYHID